MLTAVSDQRLKDVLGVISDPLDKIKNIRGVYYRISKLAESLGYNNSEREIGLIAQEVEQVLPEVTRIAPFDLDENGGSRSGEKYLTVMYERVVPLLVEALKSQKDQLDLIGEKIKHKRL